MGHVSATKDNLIKRVKRIAGQIQALAREREADAACAKTLHFVAAPRGAFKGLMEEITDVPPRSHVADPPPPQATRSQDL